MKTKKGKRANWTAALGFLCLLAGGVSNDARLIAQEADGGAAPDLDAEPSLDVLRSARDALVNAADFTAARDPAEQIVAALDGTDAGPAANDVLHLARIQAELREFDAAEINYLRAIEMLEADGGEYSPSLIGPHQSLGRTYINSRRFAEAITVLEQARHISQRNAGLFNVEQSEIIDDITMAHLGTGNTIEARNLQLQRLDNAVRRFGAGDPRVAPYHSHLGDYFDQSRLRASAREQYVKALELQEAALGASDPQLLPALRKLVQIDILLGDGPEARDRLASLLEHSPDVEPLERALSLAALGDWAAVQEDPMIAREYYLQAYAAADRNGQAEQLFDEPTMLDFIPPLSSVDRGTRSRPYAWGSITLEFDISADGRAFDVKALAADPAGVMETPYSRRIRETHFRPRLEGGYPMATAGVRFTHYFRHYVTEE
jgi:tetratricopeptide (TPR) repeat protein